MELSAKLETRQFLRRLPATSSVFGDERYDPASPDESLVHTQMSLYRLNLERLLPVLGPSPQYDSPD